MQCEVVEYRRPSSGSFGRGSRRKTTCASRRALRLCAGGFRAEGLGVALFRAHGRRGPHFSRRIAPHRPRIHAAAGGGGPALRVADQAVCRVRTSIEVVRSPSAELGAEGPGDAGAQMLYARASRCEGRTVKSTMSCRADNLSRHVAAASEGIHQSELDGPGARPHEAAEQILSSFRKPDRPVLASRPR